MSVVPTLLAIALTTVVIALTLAVFSDRPTIEPDLSIYLLPATAQPWGSGAPYLDFLDIKPPLTYALFLPWVALVGPSLSGLWLLYSILLVGMFAGFWIVLRQELSPWPALVIFSACSTVIVWFVMLEEFFFITEVIGMVPLLWGLAIARHFRQHLWGLFVGALLLGMAGQVKEVFLFAPVALLALAWTSGRRRLALSAVLAGVLAAWLLVATVLLWWGSGALSAYLDVVQVKREMFPAPSASDLQRLAGDHLSVIGAWLPLWVLFALGLVLATIVGGRSSGDQLVWMARTWRLTVGDSTLILASTAVAIGFLWQGADLAKYYALALVFPVYLIVAVLLRHALDSVRSAAPIGRGVIIALLVVGVLPPVQGMMWLAGRAVAVRPPEDIARVIASESPVALAPFAEVRAAIPPGGCMHVAYGWWASVYYLYSKVPPCNRFTAPPLQTETPGLSSELRDALIARPPDVLVVDTSHQLPSDVEEEGLGRQLFPFEQVATECYEPWPGLSVVYTLKSSSEDARACIAAYLPERPTENDPRT